MRPGGILFGSVPIAAQHGLTGYSKGESIGL